MEQLADDELPQVDGVRMDRDDLPGTDWPATRRMIMFGFAVVLVFLVLAAQYESWSLPLAVILVVPMCVLGSITGVQSGQDGHQHLHADRLRRAGRPGQQERDLIVEFAKMQARGGRTASARRRSRPAGCGCGRS